MKCKIISIASVFILLISFSAYAINFTPEETYNSVVVVQTETGVGSGFSIKEHIVITNAHVVGDNTAVTVNMYDGTSVKGSVIRTDTKKDLALIQVDKAITPLNISTDNLSAGQEVYAIGAPKDMPYTMTKGIISATDRRVGQNTYIQIDASVNPGNSGGPLIDENGNVIGVITLKASDAEGIGFAINTADVNAFAEGAETAVPQGQGENEEGYMPQEESDESDNRIQQEIVKENDRLKIILCISAVLNIVLVLLSAYVLFKHRPPKGKDEFDFEIEIEE